MNDHHTALIAAEAMTLNKHVQEQSCGTGSFKSKDVALNPGCYAPGFTVSRSMNRFYFTEGRRPLQFVRVSLHNMPSRAHCDIIVQCRQHSLESKRGS